MKGFVTTLMAVALVAMMGFIWGPFNTDTLNVPVDNVFRLAETVATIIGFAVMFNKMVIKDN